MRFVPCGFHLDFVRVLSVDGLLSVVSTSTFLAAPARCTVLPDLRLRLPCHHFQGSCARAAGPGVFSDLLGVSQALFALSRFAFLFM